MNAAQYIRKQTRGNERACTVYRPANERTYDDGGREEVGETAIWLFDASATSNVVTEGTEEETSFTGLLRVSQDLQDGLSIADEIEFADAPGRRYEVRTKVGVPTELDPVVWQLGIERANS